MAKSRQEINKTNQKHVNKYITNNYDRINLTVYKGQKDVITAHATSQGESVNAFINRAITQTMESDNKNGG
jgi:uncharacterized protein (DUF1778 family)